MSYIDRERLKVAFLEDLHNLQSVDEHTMNLILIEIDEAPAADVVEVVRCFQCAHHEENGYHWCNKWEHILPDDSDFFCKWGRKKEAADAN